MEVSRIPDGTIIRPIERNADGDKWCPGEKAWFPESDFGTDKIRPDELTQYCKKYRRVTGIEKNGTILGTCARMLYASKQRAKKVGLAHNIDLDYIRGLVVSDLCPLLLTPFDWAA